jgi:protein-S-isoprenylcysteine O-methyltransferase Ste14
MPGSIVAGVLLVEAHHGARVLLYSTFGVGVAAEVLVTVYRRGVDGLRPRGSNVDRGTKRVLALFWFGGFVAALAIARVPALRAGANTWLTYGIGMAVLWAGITLRVSAVWSLGRYFRREVTIEEGQSVYTGGPYRWVRHPAYLGDLLISFGFGLALGSWIGAAAAVVLTLIGHVPRIRVEEEALRGAFGESYEAFARGRARLVPGVW